MFLCIINKPLLIPSLIQVNLPWYNSHPSNPESRIRGVKSFSCVPKSPWIPFAFNKMNLNCYILVILLKPIFGTRGSLNHLTITPQSPPSPAADQNTINASINPIQPRWARGTASVRFEIWYHSSWERLSVRLVKLSIPNNLIVYRSFKLYRHYDHHCYIINLKVVFPVLVDNPYRQFL